MPATVDDLTAMRRVAMDKVVGRIAQERGLVLSLDLRRELSSATEVAYQQWFKPMQRAQPQTNLTDVELLLRQVYEIDTLIGQTSHDEG